MPPTETATLAKPPATARGVSSPPPPRPPPSTRLASMDAYRGFVMLLMMAEVLRLAKVAAALPQSGFWKWAASLQTHVPWVGCSLHDLIQPSFSFLVGVALPYSIASREARGQSRWSMTWHAAWRALVLVLLGVFLRSIGRPMTNWTLEDTLSQIGLGYVFLFVLGFRSTRAHWIAFAAIVVGYWAAFALHPVPENFDYARVGVPADWLAANGHTGFAAHWQKNSNLAWDVDTWLLNLFPRKDPFLFNRGGYATLSFIPTLGTMILGLIAGNLLRSERPPTAKIRWFVIAGAIGIAAGLTLGALGVVPVVKRIWTPSWVLFSGGWCFLLLAAFYWVIDVREQKGWAFPLIVVGVNSIAAYLIAHLFQDFILSALTTHFGVGPFRAFGAAYEPFVQGAVALLIMWALLWWMNRRKLYLKI